MLETPQAIENVEEIAAVDGIDILLIGTNDLCMEMGIPGQFGDPRIGEIFERGHRRLPAPTASILALAASTTRRWWSAISRSACSSSWSAATSPC